jgi:hypothetical protein
MKNIVMVIITYFGHHVFVPYVTILKLVIIPNVYTNPEIPILS